MSSAVDDIWLNSYDNQCEVCGKMAVNPNKTSNCFVCQNCGAEHPRLCNFDTWISPSMKAKAQYEYNNLGTMMKSTRAYRNEINRIVELHRKIRYANSSWHAMADLYYNRIYAQIGIGVNEGIYLVELHRIKALARVHHIRVENELLCQYTYYRIYARNPCALSFKKYCLDLGIKEHRLASVLRTMNKLLPKAVERPQKALNLDLYCQVLELSPDQIQIMRQSEKQCTVIKHIPPDYYTAYLFKQVKPELSYNRIAEVMGLPKSSVYRFVHLMEDAKRLDEGDLHA